MENGTTGAGAPCVIFDLDGTLADTSGDLIDAANACFQDMGAGDQLQYGQDARTALRGGKAMLRLGFSRRDADWSEADVERYYPFLLTAYGRSLDRHTTLYPGAMAAVEALIARGVSVGICTNKPEGLARELMTRLGVLDRFGVLIGADTLPVRKPDPAPLAAAVEAVGGDLKRTILVGDTDTDRTTARNAGAISVLVTFGPEGPEIARLEPEALLDRYDDLPPLVDQLLGLESADAS